MNISAGVFFLKVVWIIADPYLLTNFLKFILVNSKRKLYADIFLTNILSLNVLFISKTDLRVFLFLKLNLKIYYHIVINYAIRSVFLELWELYYVMRRDEGFSFCFPNIVWIWWQNTCNLSIWNSVNWTAMQKTIYRKKENTDNKTSILWNDWSDCNILRNVNHLPRFTVLICLVESMALGKSTIGRIWDLTN